MSDLAHQVAAIVAENPGLRAREIAKRLGVDRKIVNACLYGELKANFRQDNRYCWYPIGHPDVDDIGKGEKVQQETPLAQLCGYYLDCLSHDDLGGISEFASSKFGDPNYVELRSLPMFDETEEDPFALEQGQRLLSKIRRDRNRQTLFLGYPVRLNLIRSKKGWEGLMVEPILLFPFKDAATRYASPQLSEELPQINFKALRTLSSVGESSLMEEAIMLADDLGLGTTSDEQPEADELLTRLRLIRPEWDWQEEIDPHCLSEGQPLAQLTCQGIYNRGILISAERSPYTKGLETELGQLQSVDQKTSSGTALGSWLSGGGLETRAVDQEPLLEVVPLNSEQRQAVRNALQNQLTVITGPPGTGKSQVVTSILVNAAWQGKTVLFASKNNKAVDVVETRVNALGPRPVLLRLGSGPYQSKLAEYLISLLAARATEDDVAAYRECEANYKKLEGLSAQLDAELEDLIELRNDVDRLEQKVEEVRQRVGHDQFLAFRLVDPESLKQVGSKLQEALEYSDRRRQSILVRIFWSFLKKGRYCSLARVGQESKAMCETCGEPTPECPPDDFSISEWIAFGARFEARTQDVLASNEYFERLGELVAADSIEHISTKRKELTEVIAKNSGQLWRKWLRLQPKRLSQQDRKLLGDYSSILQLVVAANDENRRLSREVFRKYYELFPKVMSILSCWAVTSLSAKGRIPFERNFFDILVIDEASQCDIASALPLLFRAKRVVVIGDPMQLRHISTLTKHQDQQLLTKYDLLRDHPGWSYSTRSLFDLASSLCQSDDIVVLRDHHRSHADIIGFSNDAFYEGRLRIATNYERLRFPQRSAPAVRWINVRGKARRPGSGGAINEPEAAAVVAELERLSLQNYRGSIGVVSPFRAQANRIRDLVFGHSELSRSITGFDFLSDTVHKFQGDERDVMIFSPVVSDGIGTGALSFLRSNPNLFNVAVTRARACLVVVGGQDRYSQKQRRLSGEICGICGGCQQNPQALL